MEVLQRVVRVEGIRKRHADVEWLSTASVGVRRPLELGVRATDMQVDAFEQDRRRKQRRLRAENGEERAQRFDLRHELAHAATSPQAAAAEPLL